MTDDNLIGLTALGSLMWLVYALSPEGTGGILTALGVAALAVSASLLVKVWDELRLLWLKKRGRNIAKLSL